MKIIKDIVKSALISIMISMCIFVIVGMIFDQIGNGNFALTDYRFTKMVLACVVTGVGFGVPTFLYSMERLPKIFASVIHLGIGFTLYFASAVMVGWIPTGAGLMAGLISVIGMIIVGLIIWICFMKYNRNLADKINKALEQRK